MMLVQNRLWKMWSLASLLMPAGAITLWAAGPLAAKATVTVLQSYSGTPLPKPSKITIDDLAIDLSDLQVDKSQSIRPRHMIAGDENPEKIAKRVSAKFSEELAKKLKPAGIAVDHGEPSDSVATGTLTIGGRFNVVRQGDKTERVAIGMGEGAADVQTILDANLKTSSDTVLLSRFQTSMKPAENIGAAVPVAAGLDPAAVAAKSVVADRKKTVDAYITKSADAAAGEVLKVMAQQGWIKLNDKGEVTP